MNKTDCSLVNNVHWSEIQVEFHFGVESREIVQEEAEPTPGTLPDQINDKPKDMLQTAKSFSWSPDQVTSTVLWLKEKWKTSFDPVFVCQVSVKVRCWWMDNQNGPVEDPIRSDSEITNTCVLDQCSQRRILHWRIQNGLMARDWQESIRPERPYFSSQRSVSLFFERMCRLLSWLSYGGEKSKVRNELAHWVIIQS